MAAVASGRSEREQGTGAKAGKGARKVIVPVVGFVVLAAGVVMLVLPGPGVAVIFLGLAILSTRFRWAKQALKKTREWIGGIKNRVRALFHK